MPHRLIKKTQGGALLTALFIMTLVAIVATAMSTRLQLDIYRTRLVVSHDNLYLASQLVTFWSLDTLAGNTVFSKANEQGLIAQLPRNMQTLYKQVTITGGLYDLQSRFNLNSLADRKLLLSFITLQNNSLSKSNETLNKNTALAVNDWLAPYTLGRGKDEYTAYYLSQKPPYFPGHLLMQSTSEFRLIKAVSADQFLGLEPFIIALPEATPININTAPRLILKSLGNGLSDSRVEQILQARGEDGIKKLGQITELIKKFNLPTEQITVESQYFLSIAHVESDDFNLTVYTMYKRIRDRKGKISVGIVRESINNF